MGILLIGCGQWGNAWAATLEQMGELTAICELDPQRRATLQTRYPKVTCFNTLSEALLVPDVEAAIIATPTATHANIAQQCLTRNKPVLVESLMTSSSEDAEQLVHLANKRALGLAVGYPLLYHRAVQTLFHLIHSETLGSISTIRICQESHALETPVGPVWEQWGHTNVALLHYLLNEPLEPTGAVCSGIHTSADPTAAYFAAFKSWSGCHASIEVNGRAASKQHNIAVTGAQKMVVLDLYQSQEKALLMIEGHHRYYVPLLEPGLNQQHPELRHPTQQEARVCDNLLKAQAQAFLAAIRHGGPLINPGKLGAHVVAHMNQIEALLNNKQPKAVARKTATPLPLQQRHVRHLPRGIL